jgi:uncharacterized protein
MIEAPIPSIELPEDSPTPSQLPPLQQPALYPTVPWGWRDVGKAILLMIVGGIVLVAIVVGITIATDNQPDAKQGMTAAPLFWLGALVYALIILAVYLFAVRRAQGDWSLVGFRAFSQRWWPMIPLLALGQLLGMSLINMLFVLPFTGGNFENPQIEALTGGSSLSIRQLGILFILVAIIAPIAEELFFRGMLYPLLRQRWSPKIAIVINGLVFALIHFIPILIPGLFFVGMVLAWVRERSGSIIPCMLLHAVQNGLVLLSIYAVLNSG